MNELSPVQDQELLLVAGSAQPSADLLLIAMFPFRMEQNAQKGVFIRKVSFKEKQWTNQIHIKLKLNLCGL